MAPKKKVIEATPDFKVFDDTEVQAQITAYEDFLEKTLALIPRTPTAQEAKQLAPTLRKIEEVQDSLEILRARISFTHFCEYVIRDDESNELITLAPLHRRWAELLEENRRLIIWSHRNAGKTTILSVARVVYALGRNPNLRIMILSNTTGIAKRIMSAIARLISESPELKKVFPHLVPNPDGPWSNSELLVIRRSGAKDPSVRAVGVSTGVTSSRVDFLIVDDILDFENTSTANERKKVEEWYRATVPGCLTASARVVIVGTAYHPDDFLFRTSKVRGFKWFRFPLIAKDGAITWPEVWTPERIQEMKDELGPAEFARQCQCRARSDDESRFRKEWLDSAMARGEGVPLIESLEELDEEERAMVKVFTGVDLSTGKKKKKTDRSAFFTILQYPNGDRRIAALKSAKLTGPEIIERVEQINERFGGVIAVEDNGAQLYILQFAKAGSNVPVVPHTTTKAKRDPILGVEGLAIELANGKWIIPSAGGVVDPEIAEFITECLYFDPKAHTGDRLMACYFAREVARRFAGEARSGPKASFRVLGPTDPTPGSEEPYREGPSLRKMFDIPDMP